MPLKYHYELEWLLIIAIPESDFLEAINKNTYQTIVFSIIILLIAIIIGSLTTCWINQAIVELSLFSQNLAKGNWDIKHKSNPINELEHLSQSFILMSQKLQNNLIKLQEKEQSLKQFLEAIPVGISVNTPDGNIFYINQQGKKLFSNQILEDNFSQNFNSNLINNNQEYLSLIQAVQEKSIYREDIEINQENIMIPLAIWATPIYDHQGNLIYTLTTFLDITDRKKAENLLQNYNETLQLEIKQQTLEIAEAKEKAEVANHAKSAFLANMSHELRSPLNVVLGFTRLMIKGDNLSQEIKENLGIIKSSGEHLLNLINNVLDLTKIEAGKTILNCHDFSLDNLLKDIEMLFTLKAEEKNINLQICRGDNLPCFINTDGIKLRQVLINLIDNALKFTSQGMIIVTVNRSALLTEIDDKNLNKIELNFSIEDTGKGIPEKELENIFQPFQQIEINKDYAEGTGLGLAISRQFINLMGGNIEVNSKKGMGSKFTFNIVVTEVNNQMITEEKIIPQVISLAKNQPNYRLLIVDDKPLNRQLLRKILQPLGFDLKEAQNGKEAITIWQQWQPDLIWLDMKMPIMDGYDTVKYIKNNSQGKNSIIIALTASALISERNLILDAGCDDFLAKPFLEIDIYRMLEKHLRVSYIYQEENLLTKVKLERKKVLLTSEDLKFMPLEWRKLMYENALKLNEEEMLFLINKIPEEKLQIKKQLREMINNFDIDIIIQLLTLEN